MTPGRLWRIGAALAHLLLTTCYALLKNGSAYRELKIRLGGLSSSVRTAGQPTLGGTLGRLMSIEPGGRERRLAGQETLYRARHLQGDAQCRGQFHPLPCQPGVRQSRQHPVQDEGG